MNDVGLRISKPGGYSSQEACRLVGITYRQLDYWLRVGIIVPECVSTPGSGGRRRFTNKEVRRLKEVVTRVADAHATLRSRMDFGRPCRCCMLRRAGAECRQEACATRSLIQDAARERRLEACATFLSKRS